MFKCHDADGVPVWGDTVPVNGYCQLSCATTTVPDVPTKIYCEADAVHDDTKNIYSKLTVINESVNQWKGLEKLMGTLSLERYNRDQIMQQKWSEQTEVEADETKEGWLCYQHIQPTYAEAWGDHAWSACNARGWRFRTRACEGTCDDALQYEKCDFEEE